MTFFRKARRCHWYNDEGQPRVRQDGGSGCRHSAQECEFVHPEEPQWIAAISSRPPYYVLGRSRAPPGDKAGYRRPRSRSRSPQRRPSNSAIALRKDREQDPRYRRDDAMHPRERSPAASTTSVDGRSMKEEGKDESSAYRNPGPSRTMPPPPSVNTLPAEQWASQSGKAVEKELTPEEKRNIWIERIKILSDAVISRTDYLKYQKEEQSYRRLAQSQRFAEVSEEDKARFNAPLTEIELQIEEKRKELNATLPRLLNTSYWPLAQYPPPTSTANDEMKAVVATLQGNISELYTALAMLQTRSNSSTAADNKPDIASLNHESEVPSLPAKHRPLSGDTSAAHEPTQSLAETPDGLDDRLQELEVWLGNLENRMNEHEADFLPEMEALMQTKLDEYSGHPPSSIKKINEVEQELQLTGGQISELAQELALLIQQMRLMDMENVALRYENEQLKAQIAALTQQQHHQQEAINATRHEIHALNEAVSTALSSRLQGPHVASPIPPVDMESLVAHLKPFLLQSVHEDIRPLLQNTQNTIGSMLQEQNTQVYTTVLSKIATTLKTVEVVSAWMDHIRRQGKL